MVTDVIQEPQTDQVPDEQQTEAAEVEESTPDDAAEAVEEAAVEEEQTQLEPAERTYTEAELRAERERAQQEALEYERRQRQAEGARRAALEQRERQERQELTDMVQLAISRGEDADQVNALMQRYTDKREGQWFERHQDAVRDVVRFVTQPLAGGAAPALDERGVGLAKVIAPAMQQVYDAGVAAGQTGVTTEYIPKSDLKKYVDAEIARRNQKGREGQQPIRRAEGTPSTLDRSIQAVNNRIANNQGDAEDKRIWRERYQ